MKTKNNLIDVDQIKQLVARFMQSIPPDLPSEMARQLINDPSLVKKFKALLTPQTSILPANGEIFKLTLDAAIVEDKTTDCIFNLNPNNFYFLGKRRQAPPLTRRFKLFAVGECLHLNHVRGKLMRQGHIPEGSWIDAFRKAYPENDDRGPIGVADPSWCDLGYRLHFPALSEIGSINWTPFFRNASWRCESNWRWLVEVKTKIK